MKLTIDTYGDYYHEILIELNGWSTTWKWYGSTSEFTEELRNFVLEDSLNSYIEFCMYPNDAHYYKPLEHE